LNPNKHHPFLEHTMTIDPAAQPPAPAPAKRSSWKLPCLIIAIVLILFAGGGLILCGGGIAAALWGTSGPRNAVDGFLKATAAKDRAAEHSLSQGLSEDDLDKVEAQVEEKGAYQSISFGNTTISNSRGKYEGTATFSSGTYDLETALSNSGGWKVIGIYLHPDKK
jgi:hypothetical protein